jgi:hypothetical protein
MKLIQLITLRKFVVVCINNQLQIFLLGKVHEFLALTVAYLNAGIS